MRPFPDHKAASHGFALIVLAVILAIAGILMVSLFSSPSDKELKDTVKTVNTKIKGIHDALIVYYNQNSTFTPPFPKPASLTATSGTGYLKSLVTCSGTNTSSIGNGCVTIGNIQIGGVPTRTLSLPDDYAFDEWGNRLTYVVDTSGGDGIMLDNTNGAAALVSYITGGTGSGQVNAVILSHGKDGAGSYTKSGTPNAKTCTSVSTYYEYQNCNWGAGTTFYMDNKQVNPSGATTYDDFTNYVAVPPPGIYVVSRYSSDHTVQKFDSNGNLITFFGQIATPAFYSTSGQAMGIAIDANGNRWVVDYESTGNNSRIIKYNSYGNFSLKYQGFNSPPLMIAISTNGSWSGDIAVPNNGPDSSVYFFDSNGNYLGNVGESNYFSNPNDLFGIAFDSTGNYLWLSSVNNGTDYFGKFAIAYADTTNLVAGTWSGTPITYNYLTSLAFNATGQSLWMTDFKNNRLMKCNTSGSCTQMVPLSGTAAGATSTMFNGLVDVVLDNASPNQNSWVTDTFNNRVLEYDSNGNWLLTIGGGGICTAAANCTCTNSNSYSIACTNSSPPAYCNTVNGCASSGIAGVTSPGASYYFNQPYGIAYGK